MTRTLRQLQIIAGNTIRELVRSKLLYNLLIFAVLLIASSLFVAQLTIGQWDRVILDMGLAAIQISGLLVSVLIGVSLLAGEIDKRTLYPTLARPISRGTFLLGRYCGLCVILAVNVLVMLGCLGGVLQLAGYSITAVTAAAAALIFVELALMAAFALFFSSFTTPVLASAFSLSMFLIGHLLGELRAFGQRSHSDLARDLSGAAYRLLPDLELLNLKSQAANQLPFDAQAARLDGLYGLAYTFAVLAAAVLLFRRRDLK
jgi:ABC-type transport system involved in multi-copper enzyme maturation permease subunit